METPTLILLLGQFAFLLGVFWILIHYLTVRRRLRVEERSRMLDRFTSTAELEAFLGTKAGGMLLDSMLVPRRQGWWSVSQAYGAGITLLCIGCGFLILLWSGVLGGRILVIPGVLALATGTGVTLSSRVAQRLLRNAERDDSGAGR